MRSVYRRFQEDLFFRSTVLVTGSLLLFSLLLLLVLGFGIYHQQQITQQIIDDRRIARAQGNTLSPESLDIQLRNIRNETLWAAFTALAVLACIFGYLSSRFALRPTRTSLEYQKRFIGNIAHELRTPLAIIRTNSEVALMDPSLTAYSKSTFSTTIGEIDRVSEIINNLLSFDSFISPSRIRFEALSLNEVAREVIVRHADLAREFEIAIGIDEKDQPSYVLGNRVALEQVITNLVKNALNYTPQRDGRSVLVRIDDKEDEVAISVIDSGIGIAQKDLYHVFQPYFRGDTSRERGIGSGTSGLGLAIVHDIVRAHDGHITVRSALNRGTTIEITFPKAPYVQTASDAGIEPNADNEYSEVIS